MKDKYCRYNISYCCIWLVLPSCIWVRAAHSLGSIWWKGEREIQTDRAPINLWAITYKGQILYVQHILPLHLIGSPFMHLGMSSTFPWFDLMKGRGGRDTDWQGTYKPLSDHLWRTNIVYITYLNVASNWFSLHALGYEQHIPLVWFDERERYRLKGHL